MLRFRAFRPLPQPPGSLVRICPLKGSGLVGFLSDEQVIENGGASNRTTTLSVLEAEVPARVWAAPSSLKLQVRVLPHFSQLLLAPRPFLVLTVSLQPLLPLSRGLFIRTPGIRCRAHSNPVWLHFQVLGGQEFLGDTIQLSLQFCWFPLVCKNFLVYVFFLLLPVPKETCPKKILPRAMSEFTACAFF